jgi:hypothetical protein
MRRLHALAIQLHLATAHCFGRERAGLEEAHVPQPLVDAVAVGIFLR